MSRGFVKRLGLATGALLLLVLVWRVLSLGLADYWARSAPDRALFWRPNHPEALFRRAEQQAAALHWPQAVAAAKLAQKANPLDGRPVRVLAQAAEAAGQQGLARQRYQLAARLAPRDTPTHLWLLNDALRQRQPVAAVQHLDALLRLNPEARPSLFPHAAVLAVNPLSQAAMLTILQRQPPWRTAFLKALARSPQDTASILPVFTKLRAATPPLSADEYAPWLKRLIAEQRYDQAYVSWATLLPKSQWPALGYVFDGGFELPFAAVMPGFGWQASSPAGAQVEPLPTAGAMGENALLLSFEGRRTPFAHLRQLRVLPVGRYQLSYRTRADGLQSSRGLVWRLRCLPSGPVLAESEPMLGHYPWQTRQLDFSVPSGCAAQELLLRIPARIPAETQIYGDLWLDDLSIQRLDEMNASMPGAPSKAEVLTTPGG